MKTNEQLLIDYAKNRSELRNTKAEIYRINYGEGPDWDCGKLAEIEKYYKAARADYYDDGGESGWPGWDVVLAETGNGYPDYVHRIGQLHDQRRLLNKKAGVIRTAIAARGRKLLKAQS